MERSAEAAERPESPPPESPAAQRGEEGGEAGAIWDWGNLLDFTIEVEDPFVASWEGEEGNNPDAFSPPSRSIPRPGSSIQESSPGSSMGTSGEARSGAAGPSRVRKRDPRLVCDNFLAGRIPCACPELDSKAEEEEQAARALGGGGRKKVRIGGVAGVSRCQVPGCGVDISELKGYHRRHRVCLKCANASSVFLDGEAKRYCQQCGKFHVLPDFDEGKRSCRRKLERHNRRRRRRSGEVNTFQETEPQPLAILPIVACEDEQTKAAEMDTSIEGEDREVQIEEKIDQAKSPVENMNMYSSMCPTGRVSFKLYDWNPADFPRRLRHQIFQWLSSMPVELEGYIRAGCVILTLFIAAPGSMWDKLAKESSTYVSELLNAPGSLFSGKGNMLIYLNNKVFQVMNDGTFLANINMEVHGPKIHFVYPNCFVAGKSADFIICGSNLLHGKFRVLVSFSGKYLNHEMRGVVSEGRVVPWYGSGMEDEDHQMIMIRIHSVDAQTYGPGFIEVENECGTSNFIPILFGNEDVCLEMMMMQEKVNGLNFTRNIVSESRCKGSATHICDCVVSSQASMSDFHVDCGWLLKKSTLDKDGKIATKIHVMRLNRLLGHLLKMNCFRIMESSMDYLESYNSDDDDGDDEVRRLVDHVSKARDAVNRRKSTLSSYKSSTNAKIVDESEVLTGFSKNEESRARREECSPMMTSEWRGLPGRGGGVRLAMLTVVMVIAVTCCGVCIALLHPHETGDFMVTMRRCLFGSGGISHRSTG